MTNGAVCVRPFRVAEMTTFAVTSTALVVSVNEALDCPALTKTDAGTAAFAELDDRRTCNPPAGATLLSTTTPVTVKPPPTLVGDTLTPLRVSGLIFNVSFEVLPHVTEIATSVEVETLPV
jgi:hypothetical protein